MDCSLWSICNVAVAAEEDPARHIDRHGRDGRHWIRVWYARSDVPTQGWKLHVSSGSQTAEDIIRRVVRILLEQRATFKVVGSLSMLKYLNSAEAGASQIGKFITVYPVDDQHAVELARLLHDATLDIPGPRVPSDRQLVPGSRIFYRYGAFHEGRVIQTPIGEILPAIVDGQGTLVPDPRRVVYSPPTWLDDPFVKAGVSAPLTRHDPMVADRYLALGTLHRSHSTLVELALDLKEGRRCVLKHALYSDGPGRGGLTSYTRLRAEAEALRQLATDMRFPTVLDLITHDEDLVLVLEDLDGMTLEQHVSAVQQSGRLPPVDSISEWGRQLAGALGKVHESGFVHGDVKPSNVILGPEGTVRLLDFNAVQALGASGEDEEFERAGTPGYMSPEQLRGQPAAVSDDMYGLGCLLYYASTGAQPSQVPRVLRAAESRPLIALNHRLPRTLTTLIGRLLASEARQRPRSMSEVVSALDRSSSWQTVSAAPAPRSDPGSDQAMRSQHRAQAKSLALSLCEVATRAPSDGGLAWLSMHASSRGLLSRDLCMGSAGGVLVLAELATEFGSEHLHDVLAAGARWLRVAPSPNAQPLPGLYVGEAGIGAALLRAGQVLNDESLVQAALERGRLVAAQPHIGPDMYNGDAGRLRFHLMLYKSTGEAECLAHAKASADAICHRVESTPDGCAFWPIPNGYGMMSGKAYFGYAHGAAGIADSLLDAMTITSGSDFSPVISGAAKWLRKYSTPVLDDEAGLGWPGHPGAALSVPFWCHGAAGIGQFFLHAGQARLVDNAADIARRAALATARSGLAAGPSQCHGLAGNIEFLLDMYQSTHDRAWLRRARRLAHFLQAFSVWQQGRLLWSSEIPGLVTPDYMVGYGGVALTLLRLASPETRPRQLTVAGFSRRRFRST